MNKNFIRILTQKMGIYQRVADLYSRFYVEKKYNKIANNNKIEFNKLKERFASIPLNKVSNLQNTLPNSGGIPVNIEGIDINNLYAEMIKKESRKAGVPAFEGLALNDALAISDWKHFSFFNTASALTNIAKKHLNKNEFSALEMGCGAGSMYQFIKYMGCVEYLGLDGNPLAFVYSPYIKDNLEYFRLVNLQEEINFNYTFDLIYSFEVLEHILEEKTDYFIKTIVNHMNSNSIFICTIAHSVMDVHINIHSRDWWMKKFQKNGLVELPSSGHYSNQLAQNHPYNWTANDSHIFFLSKIS
jgi:2-polyprenyl-3-methyl-5-hydroxy-6-metoxy-1,4-benzoquinol methylase